MDGSPGANKGCVTCSAIGVVFFGGLAAVGLATGQPGLLILFGIVALLCGCGIAYYLLSLQQAAAVEVMLEVQPLALRYGEPLRVEARVTAKKPVPLTNGSFTLRCTERAINRGGTSDTTYTHTAYEDVRPAEATQTLDEGMSWTARTEFVLPDGLPASFAGRNNFIEWTIGFHLGIRGPALDIRRTQAVTVRPERLS